MPLLDLRNVTLVTFILSADTSWSYLDATIPVLLYMQSLARWGRVILFSAVPFSDEIPGVEIKSFPSTDIAGHGKWFVEHLHEHITTPFAMYFQDDGFILEPSLWEPEFLSYDYIGAPWGDGDVGNTGFSILSQKLLQKLALIPYEGTPLDFFICKVNKERLMREGIRYAPVSVAKRFSVETCDQHDPSFGYHGRHYCPPKHAIGQEKIRKFLDQQTKASKTLAAIHAYCS
jgi:hypothetical protein